MKEFKAKLCGTQGSCCPDVECNGTEVTIGEEGNTVRLTKAEWNLLVQKIRSGELSDIE